MADRSNPFSAFSKGGTGKPKPKVKRPQQQQTEATAEEVPPEGGGAKCKGPSHDQEMMRGKGFKIVVAKTSKPKKKPPRQPWTVPEEGAADEAQPQGWQQQQQQQRRRKGPRKGPVGGTVVTEEQLRQERRAVQGLQRHLAKQIVKPVVGDITVPRKRRKGQQQEELQEEVVVDAPTVKAPASKEQPQGGAGGHRALAWGLTAEDAAQHVEEPQPRVAKPKGPQQKKKGVAGNVPSVKAARRHADPVVELKPKLEATAVAEDDGNDAVLLEYFFVFPDGSKAQLLPRQGGGAARPTELGDAKDGKISDSKIALPNRVAAALQKQATAADNKPGPARLKGGLFIRTRKTLKFFSNEQTIDEPWMCQSYYTALLTLLKGYQALSAADRRSAAALSGVHSSAFPFWPVVTGPRTTKHADAEAEVGLQLCLSSQGDAPSGGVFAGIAVQLEHSGVHFSANKIALKTIRIPLGDFVDGLLGIGSSWCVLLPALRAEFDRPQQGLKESAVESLLECLPKRIPSLMEELVAVVDALGST